MKRVFLSVLSISTALFFISCGSTPEPEEPVLEAPVVEDEQDEQFAEIFDDDEPASDDETEDLDEQSALLKKIENARNAAVEAGADELAPDLLKKSDDYLEQCKADGTVKQNADDIIARYELISNLLKAQAAKKEVDENDFARYDQKDYDEASAALEKVLATLDSDAPLSKNIFDSAQKAYSGFNSVLIVTYKKLAKEERSLAYAAKKNADSVKAAVSQKERYKVAAESFQNGDTLYEMQNPKRARKLYISAREDFTALFEEVSARRSTAQTAIDEAKKRVQESEDFAARADRESPLTGENLDGIESEDTVLLEADDYESPEDAEVEIAADIDDQYEEVIESSEAESALVAEESAVEPDADDLAAPAETEETVADETDEVEDVLILPDESENQFENAAEHSDEAEEALADEDVALEELEDDGFADKFPSDDNDGSGLPEESVVESAERPGNQGEFIEPEVQEENPDENAAGEVVTEEEKI